MEQALINRAVVGSYRDTINACNVVNEIAATGVLGRSSRQRELLQYLLEGAYPENNSLANSGAISEMAIAIDVFGRDVTFDPSEDSVVRSELHRLRKNLEFFNIQYAKAVGFTCVVPKKSYKPVVAAITVVERSSGKPIAYNSWPLKKLAVGVVVLCLLVALMMNLKASDFFRRPLSLPITPVVDIIVEEVTTSSMSRRYDLRGVEQELSRLISSSTFVRLRSIEQSDFRLVLSPSLAGRAGVLNVSASVYSNDGMLIWAKEYKNHTGESLSSIARLLYMDILSYEGVIPAFYASTYLSDADNDTALQLYRCMLKVRLRDNAVLLKAGEAMSDMGCLNPDITAVVNDKSAVYLFRAVRYLYQYRGYTHYGAVDPLQAAKAEIDKAKSLGVLSSLYFSTRLFYERSRPDRDPVVIKQLLTNVEALFPYDMTLMRTASIVYGFVMGDWVKAEELEKKGTYGLMPLRNRSNVVSIAIAMLDGDYAEARYHLDQSVGEKHTIDLIFQAAVACRLRDQRQFLRATEKLESKGIIGMFAINRFVIDLQYPKDLESELQSALSSTSCVF